MNHIFSHFGRLFKVFSARKFSFFIVFTALLLPCATSLQALPWADENAMCPSANELENVSQWGAKFLGRMKGDGVLMVDAGGNDARNHYVPSGWMGDAEDGMMGMNHAAECPGDWPSESSRSCIEVKYPIEGRSPQLDWAGVYWQWPNGNWGTVPEGGHDLSSAERLTFWASSPDGARNVEFMVGGIETDRTFGDRCGKVFPVGAERVLYQNEPTRYEVRVTPEPQKFVIDFRDQDQCTQEDRERLVGGFGFTIRGAEGAHRLILDDIQFEGVEEAKVFPTSYQAKEESQGISQLTRKLTVYSNETYPCQNLTSEERANVCQDPQDAWCAIASGWYGDTEGLSVDVGAKRLCRPWEHPVRHGCAIACEEGQTPEEDDCIFESDACWGGTCIRTGYAPSGNASSFAGVMMEVTPQHWGSRPGAWDLSGGDGIGGEPEMTELVFSVKAIRGEPRACFSVGGVKDGVYPGRGQAKLHDGPCEEAPVIPSDHAVQMRIDVSHIDLSHVVSPFSWEFVSEGCEEGCEILIDDVIFLSEEPVKVVSTVSEPDSYVAGQVHSYDVALSMLALKDVYPQEAFRLGELLKKAAASDPYEPWRLRDIYHAKSLFNHAGSTVNGKTDARPWHNEGQNSFVGNQAWPMVAALKLAEKGCELETPKPEMVDFAYRLGEFIQTQRSTSGYGGYYGGTEGKDSNPTVWKATEHNIDVYVGYKLLAEWLPGRGYDVLAQEAYDFVQRMWDGDHYSTGTALIKACTPAFEDCEPVEDERCMLVSGGRGNRCGEIINRAPYPVDVQLWAIQAGIPDPIQTDIAMGWVADRCMQQSDAGYEGVGFNCPIERGGREEGKVWMEGTGQLAVTQHILGNEEQECQALETLQWAQQTEFPNSGDPNGGVVSASDDCLPTGFSWHYFQRKHVGATGWAMIAAQGLNPLDPTVEHLCEAECEPTYEGRELRDGVDNDCDQLIDEGEPPLLTDLCQWQPSSCYSKIALGGVYEGTTSSCQILESGRIKCWGGNEYGQLGQGDMRNRGDDFGEMGERLPYVDVGTDERPISVSSGASFNCALFESGRVKCWGGNEYGQLGTPLLGGQNAGDEPDEMGENLPFMSVADFDGVDEELRIVMMDSMNHHSVAVLEDGRVFQWGDDEEAGFVRGPVDFGMPLQALLVTAGGQHNCALFDNGKIKCWGLNYYGQLGTEQEEAVLSNRLPEMEALSYVNLGEGVRALDVEAGTSSTCALLENKQVKCWGRTNQYDEVVQYRGDAPGEMGESLAIEALEGRVQQISVGRGHTCTLLENGQVNCWGYNKHGQVGAPCPSCVNPYWKGWNTVRQVDLGEGVRALSVHAGVERTCAVLDTGTRVCWGLNQRGELGNGTTDEFGSRREPLSQYMMGTYLEGCGNRFDCVEESSCQNHQCVPASCEDGVQNRDESDVDCGGAHCDPCSDGLVCRNNSECESGLCEKYRCTPIHCEDGVHNGDELDVDCGGEHCGPCGADSPCESDLDCLSHRCTNDVCEAPSCEDGVQNRDEEGIDCGGEHCTDCPNVAVSLGASHTCVRLGQQVKCWGQNDQGQLGLGDVENRGDELFEMGDELPFVELGEDPHATYVSAGGNMSCAVLGDNDIQCWGRGIGDENGEGFVAVDVGDTASIKALEITFVEDERYRLCALFEDGRMKCWDTEVQSDPEQMGNNLAYVDLGEGQIVTDISVGPFHTCTLMMGGRVKCWGATSDGKAGLGHSGYRGDEPDELGNRLPFVNLGEEKALSVEAGSRYSCAVLESGRVKCWGRKQERGRWCFGGCTDIDANLGDETYEMENLSYQGWGLRERVTQISIEKDVACVLEEQGNMKCKKGYADYSGWQPHLSVADEPIVSLETGSSHQCVVLRDGQIQCWGQNEYGQLGLGNNNVQYSDYDELGIALQSVLLSGCREANDCESFVCGEDGCEVATCEDGVQNQGEVDVDCGGGPCDACANGFMCEFAESCENGVCQVNMCRPGFCENDQVDAEETDLDCGGPFCEACEQGALCQVGDDCESLVCSAGVCTAATCEDGVQNQDETDVDCGGEHCDHCKAVSLALGDRHTCALFSDGQVKCWGSNYYGQIGLPDETSAGRYRDSMGNNLAHVDFGTGVRAKQITAGSLHTCAVLTDGRVKCWGHNDEGQLGLWHNGDHGAPSLRPMGDRLPVVDLGDGAQIEFLQAGYNHNCGLLANGQVKCWGENSQGRLGLGDWENRGDEPGEMGEMLPVVDLGGADIASLAVGQGHNCVRIENNEIRCWGRNSYGQLGLGHRRDVGGRLDHLPIIESVDLGTELEVQQLASGGSHSCVLFADGRVKCWGSNSYGQLGLGDAEHRGDSINEMGENLPFVDLGELRVVQIAVGNFHTCALLENNEVKCWGTNYFDSGALGIESDETIGDNPNEMGENLQAVNLGTDELVHSVFVNMGYSCVLFESGQVKCWGNNNDGQLGLEHNRDMGNDEGEMGENLPFVELY